MLFDILTTVWSCVLLQFKNQEGEIPSFTLTNRQMKKKHILGWCLLGAMYIIYIVSILP